MRIAAVIAALCTALVMVPSSAGAAAPGLAREIEEAVELLLASVRAQTRAREDFEHQVKTGALSSEERQDYELYLDELARMVEQNRARLMGLSHEIDARAAAPASALAQDEPPPTTEERISSLDGELGDSLSEFDELLLEEMERVRRQADDPAGAHARASPAREGAQGGESGPRGEGESAAAGEASSGSSSAGGAGTESDAGTGRGGARAGQGAPGTAGSAGGGQSAGGGRTTDGGESAEGGASVGGGTGGGTPDDIPDGSDDDVVARQLREAAERETDPALKERLWEEYRRYKSGARADAGQRR